jgi:DNA-binding MarR family transcriptional regulator
MSDTTRSSETASKLVVSLWKFWRTWKLASHPVVKGQITPEQYWLLRRLKRSGPLSVSNLASGINITNGSATTATKRLERAGLVSRERQRTDERVVMVALTRKGDDAIDRWLEEQKQALANLISRVSDEEQQTLLSIVDKILEQGD